MHSKLKTAALALFLLAGSLGAATADFAERPAPKGGVLSLLPAPQTTDHSITIGGRTLEYQARAGTLSLLAGDGGVTAEIFYVAYTRQPGEPAGQVPQRPITFVFNGGPGAASAYLHLGGPDAPGGPA